MNKVLTVFMTVISCFAISGCQNMTQQDVGTISGGIAGGLLGSTIGGGSGKAVAIAAGTLAGAYLGGAIGKNMDDNDRARMNSALENNAEGQPAYWRNARTGNTYKVVPTKNVTIRDNRYCREYQTVATIDGRQERVYGSACRQPDGSWKAAN